MKRLWLYVLNLLVALDQLGNALLAGDPHSTISARAYLASLTGKRWGCVLCGLLGRIQSNHCEISYAAQVAADRAAVAGLIDAVELDRTW